MLAKCLLYWYNKKNGLICFAYAKAVERITTKGVL